MPEQIKLHDNVTGKDDWYSPANARDLTTHQSDRFSIVKTGSKTQDFRQGESPESEEYNLLGDRRVKDNNRVVEETGTSNTQRADDSGQLGIAGDSNLIVKDEGEGSDDNDDNDEDDDGANDTNDQAPHGIVRASSGELVDDALVAKVKDLNKQELLAYASKNYDLDLDGRKSDENLRLAIYDAEEAKSA